MTDPIGRGLAATHDSDRREAITAELREAIARRAIHRPGSRDHWRNECLIRVLQGQLVALDPATTLKPATSLT